MLSSILTTHKVYDVCAAATSSHNCSAERQYRTPIEYGGQRAPTAQWTVTGAGAFIIGGGKGDINICRAMPGRVIEKGICDAANMGAAMAPAVVDTLTRFFKESGSMPEEYDLILTGDLGFEGGDILCELMSIEGYGIEKNYNDCGRIIYDRKRQDVHSGGSGCGCAASVMSGCILPEMQAGRLKNILFIATGAMMSPDSLKQGQPIPAVAHLLNIRTRDEKGEEENA